MPTPPPDWLDPEVDGQTPLDPDEVAGLKLAFVATRGDLNAAEGSNIARGMRWAEAQVRAGANVATDAFLRDLHRELFGQVWRWAGSYRRTERNIGRDPLHIATDLRLLFDDMAAWARMQSFPVDEQAARMHHRLAWIHPFPNGNGRTSRAMADLFLMSQGAAAFSWGAGLGLPAAQLRARYLEAIRAADGHDVSLLMAFVRA